MFKLIAEIGFESRRIAIPPSPREVRGPRFGPAMKPSKQAPTSKNTLLMMLLSYLSPAVQSLAPLGARDEQLSLARVLRHERRALELGARLVGAAKLRQEVTADAR